MDNVTFLGVEGSGKTVLATALVNVFREHEKEGWYLRPDSRESFRFLEKAPLSLEAGAMPHQTNSLKRLAWSVQLNNSRVRSLDILDYPGEIYRLAFLEAKDAPDPHSFAKRVEANKEEIDSLLAHVMESGQVFVLFNLADADDLGNNAANLDAVWVTNACLDYLHRLPNHPTITLLLTQIDRYANPPERPPDPEALVARHLPLIRRNFPDLDILAVSAIGPASAAFGIDAVILRCLFDCEAVRNTVSTLRERSELVYGRLEALSLATAQNNAMDIIAATDGCRALAEKLPWFVPMAQLAANGFCVQYDETRDMTAVLRILHRVDMSLPPETRLDGIKRALRLFAVFNPVSPAGFKLKRRFRLELGKAVVECKRRIAGRGVVRERLNVAIVVLAIAAIVELLFILWRTVF